MASTIYIPLFLLLSFTPVYASLDPLDFLSLQLIRRSLNDMPGSNFFATWDFNVDPCNFTGVTCQSDRVVALNLGDPAAGSPGLIGRLHPFIGKLTALTELIIVPGHVRGSLPDSISQLTKLKFLAINHNHLTGTIPDSISRLASLETLDLGYNKLTGTVPSSIVSIPGLTNLILRHNRLSGSVPEFGSRSILTRLDLSGNQLNGSISPFAFPSSLQYISLSRNQLSGPVDKVLTGLDRLNYLDLSFNQFSGWIPARIFTFPITNLQLQRNSFVSRAQPVGQVLIPNVDLSYNRFYGPISPMFSTVQNLYLNNNRFTGQVPSSLVDQLLAGKMETLYLQHNFLTGIKIDPMEKIPTSSSLCLQYNCMVPPVDSPCPLKAGRAKARPVDQCKFTYPPMINERSNKL
ncbi:LRR receptor-like serine/threonine-protein kinase ER1 [Linum grandiflorum]